MQTNTHNGEEAPIYKTKPEGSAGKILAMMMRFPEAKLLADQFNDKKLSSININETDFNIYVGRNITRVMRELKYKGIVNIDPCPDKPKIKIYTLRAGLQVRLMEKTEGKVTVEVYKDPNHAEPKSDSWVDKMVQRYFSNLWG